MNKNQKIIIFSAIGVFLCLIALIIVLIVKNAEISKEAETDEIELAEEFEEEYDQNLIDSLRQENDRLRLDMLTNEFNQLNSDFDNSREGTNVKLANDSLVRQYNEARQRINSLIKDLDKEKKSSKEYQEKIKVLENEISTLKGIARHYLEEISRLNKENEGLRQEIATEKNRNENLSRENETYSRNNQQLSETVKLAKKLNITGLSVQAYNQKEKVVDKNPQKVNKIGVFFTVSPNNTAAPGMKEFYVRIISPEGNLLGSGPSFSYDGTTVQSTASRQMEYTNDELPVAVYWTNNTTLTPGDYSVEVFADGYRLKTTRFTLKK